MEDCPRTSKVNQLDELGLGLKDGHERKFRHRAFADVEQSQELECKGAVSQLLVSPEVQTTTTDLDDAACLLGPLGDELARSLPDTLLAVLESPPDDFLALSAV